MPALICPRSYHYWSVDGGFTWHGTQNKVYENTVALAQGGRKVSCPQICRVAHVYTRLYVCASMPTCGQKIIANHMADHMSVHMSSHGSVPMSLHMPARVPSRLHTWLLGAVLGAGLDVQLGVRLV